MKQLLNENAFDGNTYFFTLFNGLFIFFQLKMASSSSKERGQCSNQMSKHALNMLNIKIHALLSSHIFEKKNLHSKIVLAYNNLQFECIALNILFYDFRRTNSYIYQRICF